MKNITLISPGNEENSELLHIDGLENPILSYNDGNESISVSEGSSRFRPIHCSELELKLKNRGYDLIGTKFIKRDGSGPSSSLSEQLWYNLSKNLIRDNTIPEIQTSDVSQGSFLVKDPNSDPNTVLQDIQNEYNTLFGETMNNNSEINFYSSSMNSINLIEDLVELDLIHLGSDTYTNVLNIASIVYCNSKPGISGVFDLTIEYSREGHIYVRDLVFPAFQYNENNELVIENYITELNDEIQVEYIDKTIRVNPMNSEIDECIISRCMITYGNV